MPARPHAITECGQAVPARKCQQLEAACSMDCGVLIMKGRSKFAQDLCGMHRLRLGQAMLAVSAVITHSVANLSDHTFANALHRGITGNAVESSGSSCSAWRNELGEKAGRKAEQLVLQQLQHVCSRASKPSFPSRVPTFLGNSPNTRSGAVVLFRLRCVGSTA